MVLFESNRSVSSRYTYDSLTKKNITRWVKLKEYTVLLTVTTRKLPCVYGHLLWVCDAQKTESWFTRQRKMHIAE